jgi:methionine-rich copper-binding protein CopC
MKKFHLIIAALLLGVLATRVEAHAFLDHAEPKVGSRVGQSPTEIKAWFTQQLEPDFSSLQVLDGQGNQIDRKDSHIDAKDKTLLIVSVPALPDGQYTVVWSVVSVDTHHTHGDFKFTVKAGS